MLASTWGSLQWHGNITNIFIKPGSTGWPYTLMCTKQKKSQDEKIIE